MSHFRRKRASLDSGYGTWEAAARRLVGPPLGVHFLAAWVAEVRRRDVSPTEVHVVELRWRGRQWLAVTPIPCHECISCAADSSSGSGSSERAEKQHLKHAPSQCEARAEGKVGDTNHWTLASSNFTSGLTFPMVGKMTAAVMSSEGGPMEFLDSTPQAKQNVPGNDAEY
ncbi:hypothetical protein CYMTET_30863 [Cymbomonas tetramitiformis]|uniref:Uncharacterized protein n=1 Tax=Cymbomonas tetramitiformis TaxID=36881 RepID=A0AAE0KTQ2_9CHLO|nr:hypothetical protein CYMTET_30863 [Cymbomonas tetramitiformis]